MLAVVGCREGVVVVPGVEVKVELVVVSEMAKAPLVE